MRRPESYEEIVGNKNRIEFLRNAIAKNELPDMLLLSGPEGIGKTTLAKLLALDFVKATDEERASVIKENKNTTKIRSYRMSLDSSLDNIRDMLDLVKSDLQGTSVFILDECHCMPSHVEDALLTDSEYIPANKKIILCTTERSKISKQLLSRMFTIYLTPPTLEEMRGLVNNEILRNNLTFENQNLFVELLLNKFSKPRAALKVIDAIGSHKYVKVSDYDLYVEYEDATLYRDLILSLDETIIKGLTLISKIDSIDQLIMFTKAVLTYQFDLNSIYSKVDLMRCQKINQDKIIKFLHALNKAMLFSKENNQNKLLYAYIEATKREEAILEISKESEMLHSMKSKPVKVESHTVGMSAGSLEDLITKGTIIER